MNKAGSELALWSSGNTFRKREKIYETDFELCVSSSIMLMHHMMTRKEM